MEAILMQRNSKMIIACIWGCVSILSFECFGKSTFLNSHKDISNINSSFYFELSGSDSSCVCTCTCITDPKTNTSMLIPNLITCNGDGHNDSFIIPGLGNGVTLEIYNSWGKPVFRKENYDNEAAWNGNGESEGMYYFILYFPYQYQYKGWLHLLH
jgi:gliding motility-associated-like protein